MIIDQFVEVMLFVEKMFCQGRNSFNVLSGEKLSHHIQEKKAALVENRSKVEAQRKKNLEEIEAHTRSGKVVVERVARKRLLFFFNRIIQTKLWQVVVIDFIFERVEI